MQQLRTWLELAYFISGIGIATAALYGLQQIRLMKRDMEMRSERAAREKAIEHIARYFSTYVQLDGHFTDEAKAKHLLGYDGPIGSFRLSDLPSTHRKRARQRFGLEGWLPALNELHTIAAAFAYGVADDQLGFQAIGRTFCRTVADKYDIISIARGDDASAYYEGIVSLFGLWAPRLSRSELSAIRSDVDARLAALDQSSHEA